MGAIVTRAELNQRFGGGIQGKMLTPAGGNLMFLFSDPAAGERYGYNLDGWLTDNESVFDYTGEGSDGDQTMSRRNDVLRRSALDDRKVHLFIAAGYVKGTQTRRHRYVGQFAVDPEAGWRTEQGYDQAGHQRKVIVFTLVRDGLAPPVDPDRESNLAGRPHGGPSVKTIAGENTVATIVHARESVPHKKERKERQIEDELRDALGVHERLQIEPEGETLTLYTDVWDDRFHELYEVKSDCSRNTIRTAIGQLLDYSRYLDFEDLKCFVVLPEYPGGDLARLITSCGFGLVFWNDAHEVKRVIPPRAS